MSETHSLRLAHGFSFEALYTREGCLRLDALFCERLKKENTELFNRLMAARAAPDSLSHRDEGELLVALAPPLEDFLAELFGMEAALAALEAEHERLAPLYTCKRLFVQRDAVRAHGEAEAQGFDGNALRAALDLHLGAGWDELAFASAVMAWREDEAANAEALDLARRYAAWAVHSEDGRERHASGVLFKVPHKIDPYHLVPVETERLDGYEVMRADLRHAPRREGFDLTDPGADLVRGLDDANYCIWCHTQNKDSCSKGLREKQGEGFRKSVFGVTLAGCPLEEKISEMHTLKASGHPLGALAVICVDNPLCAATGHRVCNDCMKACVYQRQDPVDIPRSESRVLKDAINLPWGVEVYGLLGRWNPLNLRQPVPKPLTGKKVLVVGMGPAGFNLAHHLLNDGHTVVGIDGLKIEPLDATLSGVAASGARASFAPVERFADIREHLDARVHAGFGGLSEYGITVRWDKNYLKVIRLLLDRRAEFALYGGVRFGGALDVDAAWKLGFDHIALCVGAGKPTVLDVPNGFARGVRIANDFLMALQLGGAAKPDALADLQLRLPAVVIGGGLTAGDTATESLAYYPIQVERFLARYEAIAAEGGEAALRASWSEEEQEIAEEFMAHARVLRAERARAAREARAPKIRELVDSWGGVTIAYRRRLIDSPSYTLNHEEVAKAMEEGVRFAECLSPQAVELDGYGHAAAIRMARMQVDDAGKLVESGETATLPARSILVAAGTRPNTILASEDPARFHLDGRYFQAIDEAGRPVTPERVSKPKEAQLLVHLDGEGRAITAYGDLHASFAGNVVKAMASAKRGAPLIGRLLERRPANGIAAAKFFAQLDGLLRARVVSMKPLAAGFLELTVHAPLAARAWKPGQFFRLQNFETLARRRSGTSFAMEGIAVFPASVDAEGGRVSFVIDLAGGSSSLAAFLSPEEPVVLMGPNGAALEFPAAGTLLLAGEGFGCAALIPVAAAAKARGLAVAFWAKYPRAERAFLRDEVEAVADRILWSSGEGPAPRPRRDQDGIASADLAALLRGDKEGELPSLLASLPPLARIVAVLPGQGVVSLAKSRGAAAPVGGEAGIPEAAIVAPMQCMMKAVCARCIQPVREPGGTTRLVFACAEPHWPLDRIDPAALADRLAQNSVQEKLTVQWLAHCREAERQSGRPARQAAHPA